MLLVTTGFLKKLPQFPISAGLGSLLCLMKTTALLMS
jgi:hypothetical protein